MAQEPRIFNESERKAVGYFYQHLKAIYLGEYDRHFKDDRMIAASKREWADKIACYSKEQIDKGIEWIKTQKVNKEDGWQYLDIGICIGAIKQANRVRAAHQIFQREALPDKSAQERAKKVGASELEKLKLIDWGV